MIYIDIDVLYVGTGTFISIVPFAILSFCIPLTQGGDRVVISPIFLYFIVSLVILAWLVLWGGVGDII